MKRILVATILLTLGVANNGPVLSGATAATSYTISTVAGGGTNGDGGPAPKALITQPEGVAVDLNGNIYVADADDHRIRKIAPDGTISTFAGTGVPGFSGDGGPANIAQLDTPYGICLDTSGNLYVADLSNQRIRKVTPDGLISTFAGGGTTAVGDSAVAAKDARISAPRNVAAGSDGSIYISDFAGQRILRVAPDGTLTSFAGVGSAGYSGDGAAANNAQIRYPAGLAVAANGTVYIADSGNKVVRRVDAGTITTVTSAGKATLPLSVPTGIALDAAGNLYIQDNRTVTFRLGTDGVLMNVPVGGRDVTVDAWGRLYATSGSNVYRYMGGMTTLLAGAGTAYFAGDGGRATSARFYGPRGLFRDKSGFLYVADSGNGRIRRISQQGTVTTIAGTSQPIADSVQPALVQLGSPTGIAVSSRGEIFFSDTTANRIRKIAYDGTLAPVAGADTAGSTGDGWVAIHALLNGPTALGVNSADDILIADTGNGLIRKINNVGTIYTLAGGGTSDASAGSAQELSFPQPSGVAADAAGNIYFSDAKRNAVFVLNKSGMITTLVDGASGTLSHPSGLKVASSGDVYVADTGNHRIVRVSPLGDVQTIAGTGTAGFTGDGGAATSAALSSPTELILEVDGSITFSDSGNGRIRKLTPQQSPGTGGNDPGGNNPDGNNTGGDNSGTNTGTGDTGSTPPQSSKAPFTVVHGATFQAGAVAPGEIISIMGSGLGPAKGVMAKVTLDGVLETTVAGTQVMFDGRPASLFYVSDKQINAQVPYEVNGHVQTVVSISANGTSIGSATIPVSTAVPAFLTNANGTGQAIALNHDGSANSFENPANRGATLTLFATGDGEVSPDYKDGRPADVSSFPGDVTVTIGGIPVKVLYAGKAPGFVGLMQLNIQIPKDFNASGILEIQMTINGATTRNGVTVVVL